MDSIPKQRIVTLNDLLSEEPMSAGSTSQKTLDLMSPRRSPQDLFPLENDQHMMADTIRVLYDRGNYSKSIIFEEESEGNSYIIQSSPRAAC